jgi:hypothetical protein
MKIHIVKIITKVSLLAAMLVVTSVASTQGQSLAYRIKAEIPFDFIVGDKKLPAGTYSVSRVSQNSGDTVLAITGDDGRSKAIRLSSSAQRLHPTDQATLVFHHSGDQYFLFQVWPAGATTGRQFPRSRRELEIRKTLAGNSLKVNKIESVTIVGVLQ